MAPVHTPFAPGDRWLSDVRRVPANSVVLILANVNQSLEIPTFGLFAVYLICFQAPEVYFGFRRSR